MADVEKPLRKIADAFKELAEKVNSENVDVELAPFSRACSLVSPLIGCLGIAFKFAEMDYASKVDDLAEASKSITTLPAMVDRDVEGNCVRRAGSHTRNLLRVKRGVEVVRVLFEEILAIDWCGDFDEKVLLLQYLYVTLHNRAVLLNARCGGKSFRDPAQKAYTQVFAPHHGWAIRKAVAAGMCVLPTTEQLLSKLSDDEASAMNQMRSYVDASGPVILYVEKLFTSRELGIDW